MCLNFFFSDFMFPAVFPTYNNSKQWNIAVCKIHPGDDVLDGINLSSGKQVHQVIFMPGNGNWKLI